MIYYYWGYITLLVCAILIATKRTRWLFVWLILACVLDSAMYENTLVHKNEYPTNLVV